jgi:hypothetical protein
MKAEYISGDDRPLDDEPWLESEPDTDLWEPLACAALLMTLWVARLDDLNDPLESTGRVRWHFKVTD